jgi:hypothetical protein
MSGCAIFKYVGRMEGWDELYPRGARSTVLDEEPGMSKPASPLATMARSRAD